MNDDIAVRVTDVHKEFVLPQHKNTSVKQAFVNITKKNGKVTQSALDGVSFTVKRGEFFGIIGRNGGGKSTLLKILAGVYTPTSGGIEMNGNLTPFIELGVGFNPELSGRDNVFLNGALLGFTRKQMKAMYDDIVEFAELEPFMDQKLKNYSSGMQVRLAFSIATKAKNEILIFDEVLAVGDENFQKKCIEVFEELKRSGRTIIFVSHAMGQVRQFCDRVAVVTNGKLKFVGDTEKGIDLYHKLNDQAENVRTEAENEDKKETVEHLGNGDARIVAYQFIDEAGNPTTQLTSAEKFTVEMDVEFNEPAKNPALGIMFRKNPQENLFGINNFYQDKVFGKQKKGDILKIKASGVMPLAPGSYYVSFSVSDAISASMYTELDNLNNALKINVQGKEYWGLLAAETNMEEVK